ncbi:MAG TPA: hypothetical protein VIV65_02950 [Gemmatimonadaceae bacterium]
MRSTLALLIALFTTSLPAQKTKGVTYRVRMSSRLPTVMAGPSGDAAGPMVLAKATAIGSKARFDLQAFQPMPSDISLDDYLLMLDSNQVYFVSAEQKTYCDASMLFNGGGLGMLGTIAGGRRGGAPQSSGSCIGSGAAGGGGRGRGRGGDAGVGNGRGSFNVQSAVTIDNIVTDLEDLGADSVIEGRQTHHYRAVAEMNMSIMGNPAPLRILIETWTVKVPFKIPNPFQGGFGGTTGDDPFSRVASSLSELTKKIEGTPIRNVITTTLTNLGNTGMSLDFVQTTQITDIKEAEVDAKTLELPAGYTKKSGG